MRDLIRHDTCPPWCEGHTARDIERAGAPENLSHASKAVSVGEQDDLLFPYAASVSLAWMPRLYDAPDVLVSRLRTDRGGDSHAHLSARDAAAWADILDGVGAAGLAGAIRSVLALLDEGEVTR